MSVPLDRLYHWLEDQIPDDVLIYRWYPHGSKKIDDLCSLEHYVNDLPWLQHMTRPMAIFHDQEPLDFESCQIQYDHYLNNFPDQEHIELLKQLPILRLHTNHLNKNDKIILVHSEQNSVQVNKFLENNFIDVFYWSHAIISLDWFRYANVDKRLNYAATDFSKDFLIYNRAWSGTREYRLKFCELLIQQDLVKNCDVKFAEYDNNIHYSNHRWANQRLQICTNNIHTHIKANNTTPQASADYNSADYQMCAIEVVLETLFDDIRIHQTEKILRPIACGKPFILAATPGSLAYLKRYGFETFDGLIDEQYDSIQDPCLRLQCIVNEMQRISNLPINDKINLYNQLHKIAQRNKQKFFSAEFLSSVTKEFVTNMLQALAVSKQFQTNQWRKLLKPIWLDVTVFNRAIDLNGRLKPIAMHDWPPLEDFKQVDEELYQMIVEIMSRQ